MTEFEDLMLKVLNEQRRELATMRQLLGKVVAYMVDAEGEVSEKMRRFTHYMHGVHDISNMYEERGHQMPQHIVQERERCDDRYRQLLDEANSEGGIFARVRAEMASDPLNRWDHTRQLAKPKEPAT
jgi:hypothetical protein